MPEVHATAIVDDEVALADDAVIGPYCVLRGRVNVGAGTRLIASVHVNGPVTIGRETLLYPGVCLGFAPQSIRHDPAEDGCGLVLGDHNTLREGVTINRAMTADGPTSVGDHNFFMACSHVGHDCRVGSHCTFTNGALLGGHVHMADGVTLGGNAGVHQFCRVGRGAMLSGLAGVTLDVPPFFLITSVNVCSSLNLVGLRRSGASRETIDDARSAHRLLCQSGLTVPRALDALRERADRPIVAEYIEFVEKSQRGICTARHRARRTAALSRRS